MIDPETGRTVGRERHPDQAPIVAEIVRRLPARESGDSIAADLNRRGVPMSGGKAWRGGNLSKLAMRATYAGLRVHDGKVLDGVRATWPPIITEAEHYQLVAMHTDPARDKFRNPTHARHLGTGIYRCGRAGCDGRMRVVVQGAGRPNRYDCRECHKVSRHQEPVDALVEAALVAFLSRPDVMAELADTGNEAVAEAASEAARLRAQLDDARAKVDAGELTLDDLAFFRRRWEPRIADAERRARPRHLPAAVHEVAGPGAAERWEATTIGRKRAILDALLDVTILPAGRGHWQFDPALVKVTRKGAE